MFYTGSKPQRLLTRTVLEDLFKRTGPATEESFTPFNGMRNEVLQYVGKARYTQSIDSMLASLEGKADFVLTKGNVRSADFLDYGFYDECEDVDGALRLEDAVEEDVARYVMNVVYRISHQSPTMSATVFSHNNPVPVFKDEEDGSMKSLSDEAVLDGGSSDEELTYNGGQEEEDQYDKIVFLMKRLWNASCAVGINLFQVAAIVERYARNLTTAAASSWKLGDSIPPRVLIRFKVDIRLLSPDGNPNAAYLPSGYINHGNYPKGVLLQRIIGKNDIPCDDPVCNMARDTLYEFILLCRANGINMALENFDLIYKGYIDAIECNYIQSNQSVLKDMGVCDERILKLFSGDNIFKMKSLAEFSKQGGYTTLAKPSYQTERITLSHWLCYHSIDSGTLFHFCVRKMNDEEPGSYPTYKEIVDPKAYIDLFLKVLEFYKYDVSCRSNFVIGDESFGYNITDGFIADGQNHPLYVKIPTNNSNIRVPNFRITTSDYFMITVCGEFVLVDEGFSSVVVMDPLTCIRNGIWEGRVLRK